jgi:hypothetical protein
LVDDAEIANPERSSEAGGFGTSGFGDAPVRSREEDLLGRARFATILAQAFVAYPEADSLVVALYGPWGSGKTSTLNFALEALKEVEGESVPLVVRFDPWWYSNTGELLTQFFVQIGNELETDYRFYNLKQKLITYGRLTAKPAGALADLLGAAGLGSVTAQGLDAYLASLQESRQRDVRQLREELDKELAKLERGILVVIDDIDRLSGEEIRDVFKLVKATANFPNTRYFLAFDRATVADALYDVQKSEGDAYLEKIVQLPFTLPRPSPGQLGDLLMEGVRSISSEQRFISEDELTDELKALEFYRYKDLDTLWNSVRQVKRFLSMLRFTLPSVAGEVKLSDFLILEMLRMLYPEAYDRLVALEDFFVGFPYDRAYPIGDPRTYKNAVLGAVEEVTSAAGVNGTAMVDTWLEDLFPKVQWAKRSASWGDEHKEIWTSERRVCMPDFFRVATSWGLGPGGVSEEELRRLLDHKDDPGELRKRLLDYRSSGRARSDLATLLRRLGAWYRFRGDVEDAENLIRAGFGIEDFPGAQATLSIVVKDLLTKKLPNSGRRKQLLLQAIHVHGVNTMIVDLTRDLGSEHGYRGGEQLPEQFRAVSSEDFGEVVQEVVAGIEKQAQDNSIFERNHFDQYFYLWEDACGLEVPKEHLADMVNDDALFVQLLVAYATKSDGAHYGSVEESLRVDPPTLRVQLLENFALVENATMRARALLSGSPAWLSDDVRTLLEAFINRYSENERTA